MPDSINAENQDQKSKESFIKWHVEIPDLKPNILTKEESNQLFSIIDKLKKNGVDLKVNYYKLT